MSDQSDAAQKILQLACAGPLRLDDVIAEIAPLVKERDEAAPTPDDSMIPLAEQFHLYNAGQRCDTLIGPCACGAWHSVHDVQDRFTKLCEAQQQGLEAYIAKLDSTQQERDEARAERDKERIERTLTWQKQVDDHRNNALASAARVARLETALKKYGQHQSKFCNSDLGGCACGLDDAISDPAPSGAPRKPPRRLTEDELAILDPSRTIAEIVETNRGRADQ